MDIKTPMIVNWTLGYQRELWRNAALEVTAYVGNRGKNIWRSYDLNETNIIENRFVDEFRNAQRNLQINLANDRTGFANNGLPGQSPLPIFETAFGTERLQPALGTGASFTTPLHHPAAAGSGRPLANTLAGSGASNFQDTCRLVGNNLPAARQGDTTHQARIHQLLPGESVRGRQSVRLLDDEDRRSMTPCSCSSDSGTTPAGR